MRVAPAGPLALSRLSLILPTTLRGRCHRRRVPRLSSKAVPLALEIARLGRQETRPGTGTLGALTAPGPLPSHGPLTLGKSWIRGRAHILSGQVTSS